MDFQDPGHPTQADVNEVPLASPEKNPLHGAGKTVTAKPFVKRLAERGEG